MIPFLLRMEQIVKTQVPGKKGVKGVADTFNPRFRIELRGIRSKRYCRIGIENILLQFLTSFLPFKKEYRVDWNMTCNNSEILFHIFQVGITK